VHDIFEALCKVWHFVTPPNIVDISTNRANIAALTINLGWGVGGGMWLRTHDVELASIGVIAGVLFGLTGLIFTVVIGLRNHKMRRAEYEIDMKIKQAALDKATEDIGGNEQ